MTKQELLDRVQDLEGENQELQDRLDAVADLVNGDDEEDEEDEDGKNGDYKNGDEDEDDQD